MAHPQQLNFISTLAQHFTDDYTNVKILEIGSYNVNGTIREFFIGSDYLGIDLTEGPGVDLVSDGHLIDHDDNTYDITVSCECFEHNPYWLESFCNMYRMTKDGGFVIFTCATRGRKEHGTQRTSPKSSPGTREVGWDYYQNLEERDFKKNLNLSQLFATHLFLTNKKNRDLYFVGRKLGGTSILAFDKEKFVGEHIKNQVAVESAVKAAVRAKRSWYGKVFSPITFLINLPVRIAIFLPDRHYQNFSITYNKIIEILKSPLRKLFRSFSKTTPPQP